LRHSRRAYEDRNETDYVLHRIHGLARQICARPAPSASTASIARISAGLINRACATVTERGASPETDSGKHCQVAGALAQDLIRGTPYNGS